MRGPALNSVAQIFPAAVMLRAHRHAMCAHFYDLASRMHENWVQHPMGMRARNLAFPRTRTLL